MGDHWTAAAYACVARQDNPRRDPAFVRQDRTRTTQLPLQPRRPTASDAACARVSWRCIQHERNKKGDKQPSHADQGIAGAAGTNSMVALLLKLPRQQALVHSKTAGRTACTDRGCVCRSVTHRGLLRVLVAAAGWLAAGKGHTHTHTRGCLVIMHFQALPFPPCPVLLKPTPQCTATHHTQAKNNGQAINPTHDVLWAHAPSHSGRTAPITAKYTTEACRRGRQHNSLPHTCHHTPAVRLPCNPHT